MPFKVHRTWLSTGEHPDKISSREETDDGVFSGFISGVFDGTARPDQFPNPNQRPTKHIKPQNMLTALLDF